MRRIAFFVEGQTEQIFLNRLVREILGYDYTNVILKQYRGGATVPKREINITRSMAIAPRYEVLISDCGSDNRVKSEMLAQMSSLKANGFERVIGLRDLYPMHLDELPKLEKGLRFLPQSQQKNSKFMEMVIAVREVETWFIGEYTHFQRVDKRLDKSKINRYLGFDISMVDAETIEHPAKTLDEIYRLVGKTYIKRRWQVQRIVKKLDINFMENEVSREAKSLHKLMNILESIKDNYPKKKR